MKTFPLCRSAKVQPSRYESASSSVTKSGRRHCSCSGAATSSAAGQQPKRLTSDRIYIETYALYIFILYLYMVHTRWFICIYICIRMHVCVGAWNCLKQSWPQMLAGLVKGLSVSPCWSHAKPTCFESLQFFWFHPYDRWLDQTISMWVYMGQKTWFTAKNVDD